MSEHLPAMASSELTPALLLWAAFALPSKLSLPQPTGFIIVTLPNLSPSHRGESGG